MPQGSISGLLLLNIDFIDLFYECEESDIASCGDNTTPYSCEYDTQSDIAGLQVTAISFFIGLNTTTLQPTLIRTIYF